MQKYDHGKIEKKWQKYWDEHASNEIDKADTSKPKFYLLDMFPYPSGDGLHMGHTEAYTANDIVSRYKKAQGFNVLHPTGFDSFGLPAENYAIKTGTHPKETTKTNSENFTRQLKTLGIDYDYTQAVTTSDPSYYKWTQWLFAQMFKNDLVYKKTDTVNWCDSCKTVLANEQAEGGVCERCKNEVMQKPIPSWFFKITDFAEELIDGHEKIDWPEHTRKNQVNWIGKSEGAEIEFAIQGREEKIKVFTTRPDTLFGATYMVLAPEHTLVNQLLNELENAEEVMAHIKAAGKKTDLERTVETKEKTGVQLKGIFAINPVNNEAIPVFIADYVLAHYGTGAIMAVPAHDERDWEFAEKFNLSRTQVVAPCFVRTEGDDAYREDEPIVEREAITAIVKHWSEEKYIVLKWKKVDWHTFITGGIEDGQTPEEAARAEILEETGYKNLQLEKTLGRFHAKFFHIPKGVNRFAHFHTFLFKLENDERESVTEEEQAKHDIAWLSESELLKVLTPPGHLNAYNELKSGSTVYTDGGVLVNSGAFDGLDSEEAKEKITKAVGGEMKTTYKLRDWSISRQRYWGTPIPVVYDPEGTAHVVPDEHLPWLLPEDVDFMPTGEAPLAQSKELKERTEKIFGEGWTPEVDTMDTFVCSSWYYLRYPDPQNESEFCSASRLQHWLPVDLYVGGAEHTYLHLMYARFFTKALHKIGILDFDEPFTKMRHQGMVLDSNGDKMSKSKGNIVNPDDMIARFGADAVRLYMMFAAPLADEVMWDENGSVGTLRFLERVWRLHDNLAETSDQRITQSLHKLIKKVGDDIEELKFNTAIAAMMTFLNEAEKASLSHDDYAVFLRLLAPFAPHVTEELWEGLGESDTSIHEEAWTTYDESLLKDEEVTIVVQVNGKVRGNVVVPADSDEEAVTLAAQELKDTQRWLTKAPEKTIYVHNKLINFVVGE